MNKFAYQGWFFRDAKLRLIWLSHPFNPDLCYHPLGEQITEKHHEEIKKQLAEIEAKETKGKEK